jgi:hypothetical protein
MFSNTLQQIGNFASTHVDLLPLSNVGGYTNEPLLSICNDALSDLIADPNDWKFNRNEMPFFITCPNKQDYLFAGACVFCLNQTTSSPQPGWLSQGWGIDLASNNAITVSGGVVTVNTLETHRIPVGAVIYMNGVTMTTGTTANYNSTFTDNGTVSQWGGNSWTVTAITNTSLSFSASAGQNNGDIGGAAGITNFAYGTSASMQEVNNNSSPPNQYPLTYRRELPVISRVAIPSQVAVMTDLGTGVLKIRMHMVPSSTTYAVNIVYQGKPPIKTSLTNDWSPFPDNYAHVYRQAVLYRMYRYLNDPKADNEYKKLEAEIMKVQSADDAESTDVSLQPSEPLMDNSYWGWW